MVQSLMVQSLTAHPLTHAALTVLLAAGSLRLLIAVWVRVRPSLYPRVAWDEALNAEPPARDAA